jgi:hypothetical protein
MLAVHRSHDVTTPQVVAWIAGPCFVGAESRLAAATRLRRSADIKGSAPLDVDELYSRSSYIGLLKTLNASSSRYLGPEGCGTPPTTPPSA